jgi:hypothetical protein
MLNRNAVKRRKMIHRYFGAAALLGALLMAACGGRQPAPEQPEAQDRQAEDLEPVEEMNDEELQPTERLPDPDWTSRPG